MPPEKILVLAFNRDAAQDIRDRLPQDLQSANVLTFHAFGLHVIASHDKAPTISNMASHPFALSRAMEVILEIWPETGFSRVVSYTWGIKK